MGCEGTSNPIELLVPPQDMETEANNTTLGDAPMCLERDFKLLKEVKATQEIKESKGQSSKAAATSLGTSLAEKASSWRVEAQTAISVVAVANVEKGKASPRTNFTVSSNQIHGWIIIFMLLILLILLLLLLVILPCGKIRIRQSFSKIISIAWRKQDQCQISDNREGAQQGCLQVFPGPSY